MKLHTEKRSVERGGVVQEREFTIKATGKAFQILSSGLYSDKPLAIVRELSCNAYDAHRAAGKAKVPFEIKLPTFLDSTFMVKDYGTGLSHEDVIELYSTYFESTKADNNDDIGAFGLGSKSPFSYVSAFNVESRFNGMKRLYSAFINEQSVPSISLLGEQKTDEPNGMTVSFGVKRGDEDKFKYAAARALMYFNPLPKVVGGGPGWKPFSLKHTIAGTNWKVRECDDYNVDGAYVVQGFVAYPVDMEALAQHEGWNDKLGEVLDLDIDLYVPLGDVEVAASREALQYTKRTVKNIVAATKVAAGELRESFQAEFDKCRTGWDAVCMYDKFRHGDTNSLFNSLDSLQQFTWNKKACTSAITLNLKGIAAMQMYVARIDSWKRGLLKISTSQRWEPSSGEKHSIRPEHDMMVYVDDMYSNDILSQFLNDAKVGAEKALVIRGVTKGQFDQMEVDKIIKLLDVSNDKVVVASQLPFKTTRTKNGGYRPRKVGEVLVWDGFKEKSWGGRRNRINRTFSRKCWKRDEADLANDSGYYVVLDRFKIVHGGKEMEFFDEILRTAGLLGLWKGSKVIGLNEKQLKHVKGNSSWTNVFEDIAKKFIAANNDKAISNRLLYDILANSMGHGVHSHIVSRWDDLRKQIVDGEFKETFDLIADLKASSINNQVDTVRIAIGYIPGIDTSLDEINKEAQKILATFKKVMNKHKMLGLVDWRALSAGSIDTIVEYVNMLADV